MHSCLHMDVLSIKCKCSDGLKTFLVCKVKYLLSYCNRPAIAARIYGFCFADSIIVSDAPGTQLQVLDTCWHIASLPFFYKNIRNTLISKYSLFLLGTNRDKDRDRKTNIGLDKINLFSVSLHIHVVMVHLIIKWSLYS